jgi:hypothetical protein
MPWRSMSGTRRAHADMLSSQLSISTRHIQAVFIKGRNRRCVIRPDLICPMHVHLNPSCYNISVSLTVGGRSDVCCVIPQSSFGWGVATHTVGQLIHRSVLLVDLAYLWGCGSERNPSKWRTPAWGKPACLICEPASSASIVKREFYWGLKESRHRTTCSTQVHLVRVYSDRAATPHTARCGVTKDAARHADRCVYLFCVAPQHPLQ